MVDEQKEIFVVVDMHDGGAEQHVLGEVECPAGDLREELVCRSFPALARAA